MTQHAGSAPLREVGPSDGRIVLIVLVLAAAIGSQAWLAYAHGAMDGAARAQWPVAANLVVLLSATAAALLAAVWSLRASPVGWPLAIAFAAAGVMMRAPYFGVGPMLEDDHFRYLLDGAMVAHGLSPYAHAPEQALAGASELPAAVLAAGGVAVASINFPDLRSIYPGGAQTLFALAHLAAPWSVDGLRAIIFVAEALTAALLVVMLRQGGAPGVLAALVWCNPLLAFSLTGQAHIDAVLAPPILGALWLVRKGAAASAGVLLAFAVGVKLWPALLAPLFMRVLWPSRPACLRFGVALVVVTVVLCAPLMLASFAPRAGLTAYATAWSNSNAPYAWVSYGFHLLLGDRGELLLRAGVAALSALVAVAVAMRAVATMQDLIWRTTLVAAVAFYLAPAQFPWYSAWFLPLAAAAGSFPLLAASVGLPIYFLFFPLAQVGMVNLYMYWVAFLHLVPVVAAALIVRGMRAREKQALARQARDSQAPDIQAPARQESA
jgi:alpha-1,6-mannosyltransferase